MASLSCRISPRTSTVILRDRSPLATAMVTSAMLRTCAGQVAGHRVDAVGQVLPDAADVAATCAWPPSLPSVPTSRATRVTSEVNTPSCSIIVLTIVAERRNSPSSGRPSTSRRTVWSRSPLRDGRERPGHLGGRPEQVVDQRVDRRLHLAPGARRTAELDALPGLALLADHAADAVQLGGHLGVGGDDLVERVGDLAVEAGPVAGQAHREVAVPQRKQRIEQLARLAFKGVSERWADSAVRQPEFGRTVSCGWSCRGSPLHLAHERGGSHTHPVTGR